MPRCLECKEKFEKKYPNQMGKYRFCLKKDPCIKAFNEARKEHLFNQKKKNDKELMILEKQKKERAGLTSLLNSVKKMCHDYIKLRDKYKPCISCGTQWHKDFHAGHYYKAELYSSIKFNEFNINGQCVQCNLRRDGNFNEYSLNLPKRIGGALFNSLTSLASLEKKIDFKWDREKLIEIRNYYKSKIKELKKANS